MSARISNRFLVSLMQVGVLSAGLAGCATTATEKQIVKEHQKSENVVQKVRPALSLASQARGTQASAELLAKQQSQTAVLKYSEQAWVGSTMIPVNSDEKLPELFRKRYVMNFSDNGNSVGLNKVAARLSEIVGMPVKVSSDVYSSDGSMRASVQQLPAVGGAPGKGYSITSASPIDPNAIRMKWDGSLTDFLNDLTSRLGLSWEYRDYSIVIMRYVSRVYEVASFPNGYSYSMSAGATGSQSSEGTSSSNAITISEKGDLSGLKSLIEILEKMVSVVPGSTVDLAEGSGRVIVRTSKDMQHQVRDFIRSENKNMLKQVHIQIDMYSVRTSKDDQLGLNWNALYRSLSDNLNVDIASPSTLVGANTGSVRFTMPNQASAGDAGRRFGNSTAILQALSEFGQGVQYRPISLIALNRNWARKARLNTTGYLSETKPASGGVLGGLLLCQV